VLCANDDDIIIIFILVKFIIIILVISIDSNNVFHVGALIVSFKKTIVGMIFCHVMIIMFVVQEIDFLKVLIQE